MKTALHWLRRSQPSGASRGGFALFVPLALLIGCADGGHQMVGDGGLDSDGSMGGWDANPGVDFSPAIDGSDSRTLVDVTLAESGADRAPDVTSDMQGERGEIADAPMEGDASIVDAGPALDGSDSSMDGASIDGASFDGGGIDSSAAEDAPSGIVVSSSDGGVFTFSSGSVSFAVSANEGGRVVAYALAGTNAVTTSASHASNYGSTFWTSPQSDWNWPPPSEIDSGPYVSNVSGGVLRLTSVTSALLGLAVRKEFSMEPGSGDVLVRYSLLNKGTSARTTAPWEITRVAPSGIVFFPMGSGSPRKGSQDLLELTIADGVAWFAYDASTIPRDQKVFADGAEGWIAHVDGGLLLIKWFSDITLAEAAPGEAEIELFANAAHTYVEVENQGAYKTIAAGASSTWPVRWFLRGVPAGIPVTVGSTALVDFVRVVIRGAPL